MAQYDELLRKYGGVIQKPAAGEVSLGVKSNNVLDIAKKYGAKISTAPEGVIPLFAKGGALTTKEGAIKVGQELGQFGLGAAKGVAQIPFEIARVGQSISDYTGLSKFIEGVGLPPVEKTEIPEFLEAKTAPEKLGMGAEKLAEFVFAGTPPITSGMRLATAATRPLGALGTFGKVLAAGIRIASRVGLERGVAGLILDAQGADPETIAETKKYAGIIGGGLQTLSESGGVLLNAASRLYRSALKPSTAGKFGAERAERAVRTGLREGIVLSEAGVQKTANTIDDLESALDTAIEKAAVKGKIKTKVLKPYVEEVKKFFEDISDVEYADKAVKDITRVYNNFAKKYGSEIPVDVAQKIKVNTYGWLKKSYGELSSPVIEANKQLIRGLKEGIVEQAPEAGVINDRLKSLYEFDTILQKARGRLGNLNLLGIGTKAIGAVGIASDNAILQLFAVANQLLGSPISKTGGAIWLHRIGSLLSHATPEQLARVSASPAARTMYERLLGKSASELTPAERLITKKVGEFIKNPKAGMSIEAVKPSLTTKFIDYVDAKLAKNPDALLSKQEIIDFAKRPELKKGEADLLLKKLEEFEPKGTKVLHGTAEKFDAFDDSMRGSITGAKSGKGAIWFTDDPATAKAYSVYAAETGPINRLLEQQKLLEKIAQKSGKKSDWVKVDEITRQVEELDKYEATYQRRLANANVKEAVIDGDFLKVDARGKSPQELSAEGDIDSWLNEQLDKARKLGKDGVVFKNLDDAVGLTNRPATHYAIFDSSKVRLSSSKLPAQEFIDSIRRDLLDGNYRTIIEN